jgi:hypothetical protein
LKKSELTVAPTRSTIFPMPDQFQRQPLERTARGLFCCLAVLVISLFFSGRLQADQSIRGLFLRFFHGGPTASTEESALVPGMIHPSGLASTQEIAALVQSTQDKNLDVSRRAVETLISLCRSGKEEGVVRAFARAINRPPRIVQNVVQTGCAFKIPDRAEEQRVQDILSR